MVYDRSTAGQSTAGQGGDAGGEAQGAVADGTGSQGDAPPPTSGQMAPLDESVGGPPPASDVIPRAQADGGVLVKAELTSMERRPPPPKPPRAQPLARAVGAAAEAASMDAAAAATTADEREVESVHGARYSDPSGTGNTKWYYLVHWKGSPPSVTSWEPANRLARVDNELGARLTFCRKEALCAGGAWVEPGGIESPAWAEPGPVP